MRFQSFFTVDDGVLSKEPQYGSVLSIGELQSASLHFPSS